VTGLKLRELDHDKDAARYSLVLDGDRELLITVVPSARDGDPWSLIERALIVANRNEQNTLARSLAILLATKGADDLVLRCEATLQTKASIALQDCPACGGTGNRCGGADSPPCQVCDGVGKIEVEPEAVVGSGEEGKGDGKA